MYLPKPFYDTALAEGTVYPEFYDELLSQGWRHFGENFFRYNVMEHEGKLDYVLPLRIRVGDFELSKSQRRIFRKNTDISCEVRKLEFRSETQALFEAHRRRFTENVPESLAVFLGADTANFPLTCMELHCRIEGRLVAASFFDLGYHSISSIYGIFDPLFSERSLGVFTLLQELQWAKDHGFHYLYHGYSTVRPGIYEYKKRFSALEFYDWERDQWMDGSILTNLEEKFTSPRKDWF